jgi:hypothetical protein
MTVQYETVLMVGAAGGSITLYRWEISAECWLWAMQTNEVVLYDLLDGEDGFDSRDAVKHLIANSFEEGLKLLDRYPWTRLEPMEVHPQYRVAILEAVRNRGGTREEARWRVPTLSSDRFNSGLP